MVEQNNKKQFEEKVVEIRRVSKKTEGGNRFRFTALVVIGNRKGQVGKGLGKAPDVRTAIGKAVRKARRNLVEVPIEGETIPFPVEIKHGAAHLILRPAPEGAGIAVGSPIRIVAELGGIKNITGKILGTRNKLSNVNATFVALEEIRRLTRKYGK